MCFTTELVARALEMAVEVRGGDVKGMDFHHVRSSQYMARDFRKLCGRNRIAQSVGRIGSSQYNAVAESFWATLKRKLLHRCRFASSAEAGRANHRLDQPFATRRGCTPRLATCRRSNGSYASHAVNRKPHSNVSGRGEGQRVSGWTKSP
ncbi:MAG: DDE-type integrase/transposase/recombinase [Acidimicrobiales bacterium]|nr:DDE-type integrase/transposase/recombinase [Acidimicrobiales bacterium]